MTVRTVIFAAGLTAILWVGCGANGPQPAVRSNAAEPEIERRIRYYRARVAAYPRLYPAHNRMAAALLARARLTWSPRDVAHARSALRRSLDIQPNFEAFKIMAALHNFAHRFDEARQWAVRAADAWPGDTEVIALLVEAYVGLGQADKAAELLPAEVGDDFYLVSARAQWLESQGRRKDAASMFVRAAEIAHRVGVRDLVVWGSVRAAGVWLDGGEPERAQPYLTRAKRLEPGDRQLRVHLAEFMTARGHPKQALAIYEALLEERDDAFVHHAAFLVARSIGEVARAGVHYRAAESAYRHVVDAGEVYTLESLARLYGQARLSLGQALTLAERNVRYKKDRSAKETVAFIRSQLDPAHTL
ncbi:MAG: tetratricopeptide repeat protein [Proteobacteria bacterium]|nr:tetratricopeptide repeat protein [Pseudomonadota bacterium]